jgi:4-alpha-glucanotransferase
MPLGVHPNGYDVWKNQHLFAHSLQIGSPIDAVFTKGQKWGFPPLIPHLLRETNYQYFIQTLRQIIPYVNLLRLDHVMGLHRLYCIPKGFKASQGAYIRYSAEEFYAIISLESQRNKTVIVGENLGNVPHYVNKKIIKHRLYLMHILQYEISAFKKNLKKIRNESISSLNTHDMPTFTAYTQGLDIVSRRKRGFLSKMSADEEWQRRKMLNPSGKMKLPIHQLKHVLQDSLYRLANNPSKYLLINLEDLWLETMPQNIPNSGKTYPNWQKKFKLSFEKWAKNKFLCTTIYNISLLRKKLRSSC